MSYKDYGSSFGRFKNPEEIVDLDPSPTLASQKLLDGIESKRKNSESQSTMRQPNSIWRANMENSSTFTKFGSLPRLNNEITYVKPSSLRRTIDWRRK